MSENKNDRKTLWVYAVVLFTSAFIVLLITAYSQIKFNKNIDEYKNRISNEENAKNKFQINLNSALEENKNLKEELKSANDEISSLKEQISEKDNKIASLEQSLKKTMDSYNNLILAEDEFEKGDIVSCALTLKDNVSKDFLGEDAKTRYDFLAQNTFNRASEKLYFDGYNLYRKELYAEAIDKFNKSLSFGENYYFSDDCYYFAGLSEYKNGDSKQALVYLKKMIDNYADSSYKTDAESIIKAIEGEIK